MLEIADIFREVGQAYRARFGARMLPSHHKAMRDIELCRTAALGGQLTKCDRCGESEYSYHSCRNRHCPKCHRDRTERWLAAWRPRLLPCGYFLLTFTLPEELRSVARAHQKAVYGALMQSASSSLQKLAADPRYLGAQPGMIAVLHTWTRDMRYHPHVHILVTAGGLDRAGGTWVASKNPAFLLPCRALSAIFRAKVRDALRRADLLADLPSRTWRRKWVVHCQHAGTGEKVLEYLGRYVHRIAITNSRLESFDGERVVFRYRDRSGEIRRCHLEAHDFIGRFLQHVLPRSFVKIRSYGLYSSGCRPALELATRTLPRSTQAATSDTASAATSASAADDSSDAPQVVALRTCPRCGVGRLHVVADLLPTMTKPPPRIRAPP
jgi:hypothetical protein